jgi:dolichol-phosphate mannosyltransferase
MMRCLVVVPTYNERENLGELVERILAQGEQFDLLVVDDNSPDGTGQMADALAASSRRVNVLHRAGRLGLGTAYVDGFHQGLAAGYDFLYEMDADFSHDPADLPRFLDRMEEGYDVVIGSRLVAGGGVRNWPLARRALSRGGSWYAGAVLGLAVRDATGGFKCFRRQVLEALDLDAIGSNGYSFQIEVNYRCQQLGFRIAEIPIIFTERIRGGSKMSRAIVMEAMGMVWKLKAEQIFGARKPALAESRIGAKAARARRS